MYKAPYLITVRVGPRIARCARCGRSDICEDMQSITNEGQGEAQFMKCTVNEVNSSAL